MRSSLENLSLAALLCLGLTVVSCSKKEFSPVPEEPIAESVTSPFSQQDFFAYKPARDFFKQDQYDQNQTSLSFQVVDPRGMSVSGLKKPQLELTENGRLVDVFDLSSQSVNLGQKADIVFVIDVTSSMQPTINSVKTKVREFVEKMRLKKVQALLCLVTFRDHTEKKCNVIVEDNPQTPNNENLDQFLDDLSKLKATGGGDSDENQLRALIDAAASPWRTGSQKMAILVTDAHFHYQPSNKGGAGDDAPFYGDVMTALRNSQMTLFAVAPSRDGYDRDFQGNPSMVSFSQGQYFSYSDMVSGAVGMETIFQTIVDRVSTRYMATYVVENNPGLDPTLPLNRRDLRVQVVGHPEYVVQLLGVTSSQPQGHPEFKKRFKLSKRPRENGKHLRVAVNGVLWAGNARIEGDELVFDNAPTSGSRVEISYDPFSLREGVTVRPVVLPWSLDAATMVVHFNGREVPLEELKVSRDLDGNLVIDPAFSVFSEEDPYNIIERSGLSVIVEGFVTQ